MKTRDQTPVDLEMDAAVVLCGRLRVPSRTRALLWDMDGTALDTLQLDLDVCNAVLRRHVNTTVVLERELIRRLFPLDPRDFWKELLAHVSRSAGEKDHDDVLPRIVADYEEERRRAPFKLCLGVDDILREAASRGIPSAIVSNNPVEDVRRILQNAGVDAFFDLIIGNDHDGRQRKPAPDSYLLACERLGLDPRETVVLEDSLIGVEAGWRAGAFTVGVASGGATFDELQGAGMANVTYLDLGGGAGLARGGQSEGIATPTSSVSRFLEALLSATGFDDGLSWKNDDWTWLGWTLGRALKERLSPPTGFRATRRDRDVEVEIETRSSPVFDVRVRSNETADIAPGIRADGADGRRIPVRILDGLAEALEARIGISAPTAGSAPELWTAVFRLLGDALRGARSPET